MNNLSLAFVFIHFSAIHKRNGTWQGTYYVLTDNIGSVNVVTDQWGNITNRYYYTPWGGRTRIKGNVDITDRGYTGHEHLTALGLINMNERIYDPVLARFLSPDPYVQAPDFTQNYNRYAYCLNNPFKYTDPSGENPLIVAAIIGAVIGAYSGGVIANEGQYNPVKWDYNSGRTWGYMLGGGLIGGLSGSAAAGIGLIGGSPWLAGAVSGVISGAGFSGLSTNWNPEAMLKGAAVGGLSGFVGGGLGAAIGGGWGAFTGGAASAGLNTALNGGTLKQTLTSMLLGGTLSYTAYELTSYIAYKHANLPHVNYKQFKTMQADFQRSRFWHKEYGGILTKDGDVIRAPAAYRNKYSVNFDAAWTGKISPDNIQTHYHTHWDANNKLLGIDNFGNEIRTANGPSYTDKLFITNTRTIVNTGILIDRQSFYFYNMYGIGANWGSTLLRYFPFYWLYYK